MQDRFRELARRYDRFVVAGVPGAGKTTICELIDDRPVIHTDDWKPPSKRSPAGCNWRPSMTWTSIPFAIAAACPGGPLVIEGIRALGVIKAGVQVDHVVWMPRPLVALDAEQETSRKGRVKNFENFIASHPGVGWIEL